MTIRIRVISHVPPCKRCSLYMGYAQVMERYLKARVTTENSEQLDEHGFGFPSLLINDIPVLPADKQMLMPMDVINELQVWGKTAWELTELAEALETPLNRMLDSAAR